MGRLSELKQAHDALLEAGFKPSLKPDSDDSLVLHYEHPNGKRIQLSASATAGDFKSDFRGSVYSLGFPPTNNPIIGRGVITHDEMEAAAKDASSLTSDEKSELRDALQKMAVAREKGIQQEFDYDRISDLATRVLHEHLLKTAPKA